MICAYPGLSAVIWTDFVQTILMILGAFVLMITAMVRLGEHWTRKNYIFSSDQFPESWSPFATRVGGYDGLMTAYSSAEADPEFSSFHQVDGNNVTCFPIQVIVNYQVITDIKRFN